MQEVEGRSPQRALCLLPSSVETQFKAMRNFIIIGVTLLMFGEVLVAQDTLAMIKATSKEIKILDGDDLREGVLVPGLNPDIYPYHKTHKTKRIVFYTDIDSIAFTVKPGDNYNFAVVLNEKDTCFQRISYENPGKVSYQRPLSKSQSQYDTIPFFLGKNSAIHIAGTINNSDTLDLIFDTGASLGVLSEEGLRKNASLRQNNKNTFSFGGITIDNSPAMLIDYNGNLHADGVIGYNVFEDEVVEINYDRNILVIHTALYQPDQSYSTHEMIWRGSGLFIECTLKTADTICHGLFLLDTGSKWAASLTDTFASVNKLYGTMKKVGRRAAKGTDRKAIKSHTVTLPELVSGSYSLSNVPIDLELPSPHAGLAFNILGNDVLKRFNVILDYQHGAIYLKPNRLVNTPYHKTLDRIWIYVGAAMCLCLLTSGVLLLRKYSLKHQARSSGNMDVI